VISPTLLPTLFIEGTVVYIYSRVKKKTTSLLLGSSILINLLTQSVLWLGLGIFYKLYLPFLLLSEVIIWLVEGIWMQRSVKGELNYREAFTLSLLMNAASFGIGWFLPF